MGAKSRIICCAILCGAALGMAIAASRAASHLAQAVEESVPAFHKEAPQGHLPEALSPSHFTDIALQNADILSAPAKKLIYQTPSSCHCHRTQLPPASLPFSP